MVSEVICGAMRFTSGEASYTPEQALGVVKELLALGVTTFAWPRFTVAASM